MRIVKMGNSLSCINKIQEQTGLSDVQFVKSTITTLINLQGLTKTIENGIINLGSSKRLYTYEHNENKLYISEY